MKKECKVLSGKNVTSVALILLITASVSTGCGRESDEVMPDTNNEQIANPWHEITEEEALAMCEGLFKAPDGAEAVVWRVMDQGEVPLIEMEFTYDDQTYTSRVQEALNGEDDITGVYYPMGDDPAILNNWKDVTCKRDNFYGEDQSVDIKVLRWYDPNAGYNYSLYTDGYGLSQLDLTEIADSMVR